MIIEDRDIPEIIKITNPHRKNAFRVYDNRKLGGVYYNKKIRKWASYLFPKGKKIYLGSFLKKEDAINAWERLAKNKEEK